MIDLRAHEEAIGRFLEAELDRFREAHPAAPIRHVVLYSCPWAGWISLCLDSQAQAEQNGPDFEHVEVALYEAADWASEYETVDLPRVTIPSGEVLEVNLDSEGDEGFNRVFFTFLCDVLEKPEVVRVLQARTDPLVWVGVQMLDSGFNRSWQLGAA